MWEKYAKVMPIGRILDILVDRFRGGCYCFLEEKKPSFEVLKKNRNTLVQKRVSGYGPIPRFRCLKKRTLNFTFYGLYIKTTIYMSKKFEINFFRTAMIQEQG
jgi:hypothetical protein